LSKAYAIATAQFSHLRAIHEIAVRAANREAEAYGAQFRGGEIVRSLFLFFAFPSSFLYSFAFPDRPALLLAHISIETNLSFQPLGSLSSLPPQQARSAKRVENALRTWKPSTRTARTAASDIWTAEPRPSFHALEGKFSGGEEYVEGWKHWNDVTSARKVYHEKKSDLAEESPSGGKSRR